MNSLKYIITKSLIQGVYRGVLFSAALYLIFITSNLLSGNYILISSIIGAINSDQNSINNLSKLSDSMLYGCSIVILISISLSLTNNIINRKN